jgi:hypothetical protein
MATTRRGWRVAGRAGAIVVTLAVAVVGTLLASDIEEKIAIDRPVAETFLKDYYDKVLGTDQQAQAYQMLTPEFRRNKAGRITEYKRAWERYREISVVNVRPADGRNRFRASLTYRLVNGTMSRENTTFQLQCIPLWKRMSSPFSCGAQHVRILDTFDTTYE